jgi:hypothetical protein
MRVLSHQRPLAVLAGLVAAAALSFAPPALADEGHKIVEACLEGHSLSGFRQSGYSKALKELNATTEEYSDCGALIREAQRGSASGGSSGTSTPAGTAAPTQVAATPTEQSNIAGAATSGSEPLSVGGQLIHPGVVHGDVASNLSTLPGSLLVAFGFLAACLLVLGGGTLRNRIRDGRSD